MFLGIDCVIVERCDTTAGVYPDLPSCPWRPLFLALNTLAANHFY